MIACMKLHHEASDGPKQHHAFHAEVEHARALDNQFAQGRDQDGG